MTNNDLLELERTDESMQEKLTDPSSTNLRVLEQRVKHLLGKHHSLLAHVEALKERIEFLEGSNQLLTQEVDKLRIRLRQSLSMQGSRRETSDHAVKSSLADCSSRDLLPDLLYCHLNFTKNASDKWESYFGHYSRHLSTFRNLEQEVRLLEIGVQNGGSLETWKAFLGKNALVIGTDINGSSSLVDFPDGVQCLTGDATDPVWAIQLCAAKGPFDIVIDDASHINLDIEKAFALFFPSISPGGLYVCEDLHTAYWRSFGGSPPSDKGNVMEMFKELADMVNFEHWSEVSESPVSRQLPRLFGCRQHNNSLTAEILMSIESIEFCNSMVFVRKSKSGICSLGPRLVANGVATVEPGILELDGQRLKAMKGL